MWFFIKMMIVLFAFVWLRGTLPPLRYEQFMKLGWKVLIPIGLVWLLLVATFRSYLITNTGDGRAIIRWTGLLVVAACLVIFAWPVGRRPPEPAPHEEPYGPFAGGYPVPPLP